MSTRYSVGIDLGTTNSALAELDLAVEPAGPGEPLPGPMPLFVPQVVAPGEVAERDLLPSFVYLPSPHEAPEAAFALPWSASPGYVVGQFARDRGAQVPGRLVGSAKSWLSHPGVDRRSALLPQAADAEVPRISPVEASARILRHLREAWEAAHAYEGARLDEQKVTLTVPASFDASARDLTVQAAREAGLPHITLLEEPQAALYAWVQSAGDGWRKSVKPGDLILVVDVGGGTSDFSLIAVAEDQGRLALERVAVGDHILLGGDNVDLALAHRVQQRLAQEGVKLDAWQFTALTYACRNAKETAAGEELPVAIPGRGSGLVAGTIRASLTVKDLQDATDSFFPEVPATARPQAARRTGLTALGLPYAQDPAVTRHLAAFLARHGERQPTAILFNGGVFKDERLRQRVAAIVDGWAGHTLKRLEHASLDLSVALGACYSGLAREGRGIRIRGGTARAYYVGVEAAMPAVPGFAPPLRAVCLAPFGMEEGSSAELPALEVGAVVGERTSFKFFSSSVRRDDAAGAVVEDASLLEELPPIETELPAEGGRHQPGDVVPVGLRAAVTEVGTLELELVDREAPGAAGSAGAAGQIVQNVQNDRSPQSPPAGPRRWKLEFSVRED